MARVRRGCGRHGCLRAGCRTFDSDCARPERRDLAAMHAVRGRVGDMSAMLAYGAAAANTPSATLIERSIY
jgi:hypothetical protein